jgi:hypothetical protein
MIESDTWYRCNICGREGRVGRCCSDEDRTPLNDLARSEQERIKGAKNTEQLLQPDNGYVCNRPGQCAKGQGGKCYSGFDCPDKAIAG